MSMISKMVNDYRNAQRAMNNFYAQNDFANGSSNFARVPDYLR